jgi:hypothetical protein
VAKFGSTAPPDLYPEFGVYPGGGESPIIPFDDEKNAEREIIHGRWAMLGVTGAWVGLAPLFTANAFFVAVRPNYQLAKPRVVRSIHTTNLIVGRRMVTHTFD